MRWLPQAVATALAVSVAACGSARGPAVPPVASRPPAVKLPAGLLGGLGQSGARQGGARVPAPGPVVPVADAVVGNSAWLLAQAHGAVCPGGSPCAEVLGSADRGRRWARLSVPPAGADLSGREPVVTGVYFADQLHGWLSGPSLFATADGGRHWRRLHPPDEVFAVAPFGGWLYVISVRCGFGMGNCTRPGIVERARTGSDTWHEVFTARGLASQASALAVAGGRLFAIGDGQDRQRAYSTADGTAWSPMPDCYGPVMESVIPVTAAVLLRECAAPWRGSTQQPVSQPKSVQVSTDGGMHWAAAGALPAAGFAGGLATADGRVVLTTDGDEAGPESSPRHSSIYRSSDGGSHWRRTLAVQAAGIGEVAVSGTGLALALVSSSAGDTLYLSDDSGQHWRPVILR